MTDWPGQPVTKWPGATVAKGEFATKPELFSRGERFMQGVVDPLVGGKQLYAHTLGGNAAAVDAEVQKREAEIAARSGVPKGETDWFRTGGRVASTVPAMAVAGPVGGIGGAAAGGAATALLDPVTHGNFAEEKTSQALMGAASGAAGGLPARMVGGALHPTVRMEAQELMKRGVKLTPGEIGGAITRRAEEAAKSIPIVGGFIRGAEKRSIESFNASVINSALEPIGAKLPPKVQAGHDAISYAQKAIGGAYDDVLSRMQFARTADYLDEIRQIKLDAANLGKARAEQLDTVLANTIDRHFLDTGSLGGKKLKEVESELTQLSQKYKFSSNGEERAFGGLIDDVRSAMRSALERQNPNDAGALQDINRAYASLARVESAASRRTTSEGVFTPADLLASIRQADKSARHRKFAAGDAPMQDFAEFAQMVLPAKMPDSGTAERLLWDVGTLLQLIPGLPTFSPKIAGAMAVAPALYSKTGQNVANRMAQPGPGRAATGDVIKALTPYMGTGAEPILSQVVTPK